jgi:cell wall assembly regulator SMI1
VDDWVRVRTWLQAHAPVTAARLGPGAEGLPELEQHLGRPLPEVVVTHFRHVAADPTLHSRVLPHHVPLTARDAVRSLQTWRAVAASLREDGYLQPPGPDEAVAGTFAWSWREDFLPITEDGSGNCLFVDLREGEARGCVMEYDHEEGVLRQPWWPSLPAMARDLAEALARDGVCAGYRPTVEAGELGWVYAADAGSGF